MKPMAWAWMAAFSVAAALPLAAWAATATGSLRVSLQVVDSCRVRAAPNGDPRGAIVIECEARSPYKVSEEQTLERDGPVTRRIVTY